jgi:lipopolysaccharide/colanic/teichoic acid biosynthesis glycosyltransferase
MRRAVDVVVCAVIGIVVALIVGLVALAIVATMGRPVLFRQDRAGRDGRNFTLVKFRTMRPADYHGQQDVERIPALGRFLRASGLDELPQLWNILRGDMSIIGPRPALPNQAAHFSARQRGRLAVRPGLTGWAQVNGRNAISWTERIELDLWYLQHRSLRLDLRIVLMTAMRVIRPSGVRGENGVNEGFRTESGELIDIWSVDAPKHPKPADPPTLPLMRVPAFPRPAQTANQPEETRW